MNPERSSEVMILAELMRSQVVWGLGVVVTMFVGSLVAATLLIVYLPATYFNCDRSSWGVSHPTLYWALQVLKNLLGVILIIAGVAMLVLPGQGVVTILIGLMLLNFPGKRKLIQNLIRRTGALKSMNGLRVSFGKSPLVFRDRQAETDAEGSCAGM